MSKMSAKMKKNWKESRFFIFYSAEFKNILILNSADLKKTCFFEKEFCHRFWQQNLKKNMLSIKK
jgi:hypothetical protein